MRAHPAPGPVDRAWGPPDVPLHVVHAPQALSSPEYQRISSYLRPPELTRCTTCLVRDFPRQFNDLSRCTRCTTISQPLSRGEQLTPSTPKHVSSRGDGGDVPPLYLFRKEWYIWYRGYVYPGIPGESRVPLQKLEVVHPTVRLARGPDYREKSCTT